MTTLSWEKALTLLATKMDKWGEAPFGFCMDVATGGVRVATHLPTGQTFNQDQYEARRASLASNQDKQLSEAPLWDGKSWPPKEGERLEMEFIGHEWHPSTVITIGKSTPGGESKAVVIKTDNGVIGMSKTDSVPKNVRPILSIDDSEVEALAQRINDFYGFKTPEEYLCLARDLIRSGYQKINE